MRKKLKKHVKGVWSFSQEVINQFSDDNAGAMGAALAYFAIFSLAPTLIIIITVGGLFVGESTVQSEIFDLLRNFLGTNVTEQVQSLFQNAKESEFRGAVTLAGVIALIFGATGVIGVLKTSLNRIFKVKASPRNGILHFIVTRVTSLATILLFGALFLSTIILNSVMSIISFYLTGIIPFFEEQTFQLVNFMTALAVLSLLFTLLFKWLPDARSGWPETLRGGFFTALLFIVGKSALQYYLEMGNFGDIYGAAGTMVIILVWIYYSAQILFLGAEFTYVYSVRYGKGFAPTRDSVGIELVERAARFTAQESKKQSPAQD